MNKVSLVTCLQLPEADADEALLLGGLRALGVEARVVAWDDPGARWSDELCILRSTWNYHRKLEAFLDWVGRVEKGATLWNPAAVVRWNCHKGYLSRLAQHGLPVVPTQPVPRGSQEPLSEWMRRRGWSDVVVKPAVSAGSYRTLRVTPNTLVEGQAHLQSLLGDCDALIQPYVKSVEGHGERSLIFIQGELTHAIRKSPRFLHQAESVTPVERVLPEEEQIARSILKTVKEPLLYARVDLAPDEQGHPMLMELELIEPSLFLQHSERAAERFCRAIAEAARL